jgi:selenocysteine lyase/cysteine desulfurase
MSLSILSPGEIKLPDGRAVDFANLDYAATAPCLTQVSDAVAELLPWYASVHRGAGALSARCTREYEQARETVADFLNCRPGDQVVFTRNTTDALNLLARALPTGTTVVTFDSDHHANLLPWPCPVRIPAPSTPQEAVTVLDTALTDIEGPVLVSVSGASNVTGEVWPVSALAAVAHRHSARIAVDAAQLAPHLSVDLVELDVDYLALSGHKLYAPFGAGVLVGRADWLDAAEPYLAGGGATVHVGDGVVEWAAGPARHEAGTPNLIGAVALATACRALKEADRAALLIDEQRLVGRLREKLAGLGARELRLFGPDAFRVGIVSFTLDGRDPHALADTLGRDHGIGVRTGLFCAHPLTQRLTGGQPAIRASLGVGTRQEHVDRLIGALS